MKIGIYLNVKYKSLQEEYLNIINSAFTQAKIDTIIVKDSSQVKDLDILIVLGGDGTILSFASTCALNGVKILGVNCGHMGFLADVEANQLKQALEAIISQNFTTVKRSMLSVEYGGKTYYALNEAVIQRCTTGNAFSNTVNLHAEIDGSTVDNFSSDGLIISTPTGSTAYSLSAGGSILTPDLNAFIMTPICPHSLHSRPIVFNDNSVVEINQAEKSCVLNLIVDGKVVETVSGYNKFTVKKADISLEFVSVDGKNFFDKLFIKLNIWSK
ncbi:MAG: NAD(+)/NADH kinase [Candidatus Coproplasma sp.]